MDGLRQWVERRLCAWGFVNYRRHFVHGPPERLHWEKADSDRTVNAIFNTRSGEIHIGEDCVIGHGCMFLTGRHLFEKGRLKLPRNEQVPESGYEIRVGKGTWVASAAIVTGGVEIGEHSLVCAGAVVTHSFPAHSVLAGVPARRIGDTRELNTDPREESRT